jgi:hypothetical protein
MKYLKWIIPLALVVALGACAKPPQAEIDAAKAAVAKAAKNVDVQAYAAESLRKAQTALAQMQSELDAKRYDKVKILAQEAAAAAEKAISDAGTNKERAKSEAAALIEAVKKAIPEAENTIASAKKVRGLKLDLKALAKELDDQKTALAEVEKIFQAGDFNGARNKAAVIQAKIADLQRTVSSGVQAASKKK